MYNDPTIPPPPAPSRPLPHQRVWHWYKHRSKIGKLGYGCLSLLVLIISCSICGAISSTGSSQKKDVVSASPTTAKSTQSPSKPKPTPTTKPQTPKDRILSIAKANDGTDNNYIESLKVLQTTIILGMQWDNAAMKNSVKIECFDMQKALWTANPPLDLKLVVVTVKGDVVDRYGKESKEQVGWCKLGHETAKKFNWGNLSWRTAWDAYDEKGLAPFLQIA